MGEGGLGLRAAGKRQLGTGLARGVGVGFGGFCGWGAGGF
ncbi:MAG: hypothetical protein ACI9DO_002005, partial [Reinekea sp.]